MHVHTQKRAAVRARGRRANRAVMSHKVGVPLWRAMMTINPGAWWRTRAAPEKKTLMAVDGRTALLVWARPRSMHCCCVSFGVRFHFCYQCACIYLFVFCCYCFVTSLFRMSCFVPLCWFHLSSMLCRMPLTTTFPKTLRKVLWCARKYRFLHPKDREFCTCSLKCASTSATPVGVKEPQTQLSVTANPIPSDCYSEQTAARELGYNQSSWDNSSGEEPQPASDSTPWALLTSKEQEAATFLGYSDKSWDDESGLEAQPAADSKYWAQLSACGEDPCRASPACSRSLFARVT